MTDKAAGGLVIFGFGGHARSVADIAISVGFSRLIFIDRQARNDETLWSFPVRSCFDGPPQRDWQVFPAAGDNQKRAAQLAFMRERSWPIATLVAASSTVSSTATIGPGCLIAHHAHVGPLSAIGAGCILNTSSVVDHESRIGDCAHISVNATVAGRCTIGNLVFLGAGATVIDRVNIADSAVIGAGGVVNRSLASPGTYVGVPVQLTQTNRSAQDS